MLHRGGPQTVPWETWLERGDRVGFAVVNDICGSASGEERSEKGNACWVEAIAAKLAN